MPYPLLAFRARLLKAVRNFFDDREFIEVQTPVLSADSVVDPYLEPVLVTDPLLPVNHHGTRRYFLQTSPEFAMKRLLVAGMAAIYQITPVFRAGDRGDFHNVEFTMLEWYRTGDSYTDGVNLLEALILHLLESLHTETVFSLRKNIDRFSYREIFETKTGFDPHRVSVDELRQYAKSEQIPYPDSLHEKSGWLDLIFSERIQPELNAAIVYDYPAFDSQLAQERTVTDYAVSERFELFLNGVEMANGYHELLDADLLQARFSERAAIREQNGSRPIPVASRFLEAMRVGLPASCGVALGIDRLAMVLLGLPSIDLVLPFPLEEA